jgi:uncharacterized membrane protein YphA (DoxX/SURF4 family)
MQYLFLIGRLLYGGFFLFSGFRHFARVNQMAPYAASRNVPAPRAGVLGSGVLLLLGGASMLLGVWPKMGVLCIVLFLIPVSFMMHNYWKDTDPQMRMMNEVQFHKNLALLGAALTMLLISEPWPLSLGR